jgi:hypothetical protein
MDEKTAGNPIPPQPTSGQSQPQTPVNQPVANGGLRSITQLFNDAWAIFAKGWVKYLYLWLITIGVIFLLGFIIGFAGVILAALKLGMLILVGVLILIPIAVVLAATYGLAVYKLVYNVAEDNGEGVKKALGYGFRHILSYIGVMIVLGLIIIGGYILLIIPGIIFTVFLSMVIPVYILEEKHGLGAISRSWNLVKGHFWAVFGRLILVLLISMVISAIQNMFSGNSQLLVSLIMLAPTFILSYFTLGYTYLIYKDLSSNK